MSASVNYHQYLVAPVDFFAIGKGPIDFRRGELIRQLRQQRTHLREQIVARDASAFHHGGFMSMLVGLSLARVTVIGFDPDATYSECSMLGIDQTRTHQARVWTGIGLRDTAWSFPVAA